VGYVDDDDDDNSCSCDGPGWIKCDVIGVIVDAATADDGDDDNCDDDARLETKLLSGGAEVTGGESEFAETRDTTGDIWAI
jgi:hypothetical protein